MRNGDFGFKSYEKLYVFQFSLVNFHSLSVDFKHVFYLIGARNLGSNDVILFT